MENLGWKALRRQQEKQRRKKAREEFFRVSVLVLFSLALIAAMIWSMPEG